MRQRLQQFMYGRNGNDGLNRFLLAINFVLLILGLFVGGTAGKVIDVAFAVLLVLVYFRMFSKNVYKRREENERYYRWRFDVVNKLRLLRDRWVQRKDYKFFTCPSCKSTLRVPRGKGNVKVVCRKCGNSFMDKT